MIEVMICRDCECTFNVKRTGKYKTNGAHERIYIDKNVFCLRRRCYSCFRKLENSKSEEKKTYSKTYEKTKKGFLVRLYRNMKSRVTGVQKVKHHLYKGKSLLSKDSFYEWANNNQEFHKLFLEWEEACYQRRLTPSVDRIDSKKGYEIGNIQFVPFYINCIRTSKNGY